MKKLTVPQLTQLSAAELVDGLSRGEFSILESLHCKKLLRGTKGAKIGAGAAIAISKFVAKSKDPRDQRKALSDTLRHFAPYQSQPLATDISNGGIILAFNHPSLGEILRLIEYCSGTFPKRRMLFPVTLVWFEVLAKYKEFLESIGICITPTVTPNAISEISETAPDSIDAANEIRQKLNDYYLGLACDFLKNDDIMLIAPSATRQNYIYDSSKQMHGDDPIKPETLALIVTSLRQKKLMNYTILPVCVVPPEMPSQGLNLFDEYILAPCDYIPSSQAEQLTKKKVGSAKVREIELFYRQLISDMLVQYERSDIILRPTVTIDVEDPWRYYD